MVFDAIMSRVRGLVNARDARVVWVDGTLYIATSPTDIGVFSSSQPKKSGGTYKVTLEGGSTISMQTPGCGSCRRRVMESPLGKMLVDEIVAAANSVVVE